MSSRPRLTQKRKQISNEDNPKFAGLTLTTLEDGRREYQNSQGFSIFRESAPNKGDFKRVRIAKSEVAQKLENSKFDKIMYKGVPTLVPRGTAKFFEEKNVLLDTYNEATAEYICYRIAEGKTLREITREQGLPKFYTILSWVRKYPDFRFAYEEAKKLRATYYHDKILETAEDTHHESEVSVSDLKIKAYKWAAQIGNPGEYDPKPQEAKMPPVQIIIDTGIMDDSITINAKQVTDSTNPPPPKEEAS